MYIYNCIFRLSNFVHASCVRIGFLRVPFHDFSFSGGCHTRVGVAGGGDTNGLKD